MVYKTMRVWSGLEGMKLPIAGELKGWVSSTTFPGFSIERVLQITHTKRLLKIMDKALFKNWLGTAALLLAANILCSCKPVGDVVLNLTGEPVMMRLSSSAEPAFEARIPVRQSMGQPYSGTFKLTNLYQLSESRTVIHHLSVPRNDPEFTKEFGEYVVFVVFDDGIFPVAKALLGKERDSGFKNRLIQRFTSFKRRQG
jgi:hypothetical protein